MHDCISMPLGMVQISFICCSLSVFANIGCMILPLYVCSCFFFFCWISLCTSYCSPFHFGLHILTACKLVNHYGIQIYSDLLEVSLPSSDVTCCINSSSPPIQHCSFQKMSKSILTRVHLSWCSCKNSYPRHIGHTMIDCHNSLV